MLPADPAASYTWKLRGGRSGPSMTTLVARVSVSTATSPAGSMVGNVTALLVSATPAQHDAQALHLCWVGLESAAFSPLSLATSASAAV